MSSFPRSAVFPIPGTTSGAAATTGKLATFVAARAATTNIAALEGEPVIDGAKPKAGQLVLLTAQAAPAQNGLWEIHAGGWTRPASFPSGGKTRTVLVWVREGTVNKETLWVLATPEEVTIDTTAQTWRIYPTELAALTISAATLIHVQLAVTANEPEIAGGAKEKLKLNALSKATYNPQVKVTGAGNAEATGMAYGTGAVFAGDEIILRSATTNEPIPGEGRNLILVNRFAPVESEALHDNWILSTKSVKLATITEGSKLVKGLNTTSGLSGAAVYGTKLAAGTARVAAILSGTEVELTEAIEGLGGLTLKENLTFWENIVLTPAQNITLTNTSEGWADYAQR